MSVQGTIVVRVYTSNAYIPLPQVPVVFSQTQGGTAVSLLAIRYTNSSGITEPLYVSAPSLEISLRPDAEEAPFQLVQVSVYHPGYGRMTAASVQVFSGIETIQEFQLQPIPLGQLFPYSYLEKIQEYPSGGSQ